ncbi:MAG: hypothetical protein EOS81_35590 [Mesorhizobium sp.]|uniref:hypothetical protein n=2 Tax=Mesorhizobium TaxID=68287 RepID=UPI000F7535DE|nr:MULTISPECIES: hypothetical protein [unclassified Mesorhizobium]RUX94184.1 hypothetical protein EOA25_30320 [Mesorhizobium sp. M2A.F.Ca.ET.040.01.1.1]RVC62611.1 hypothetical protein EN759_27340 [Mesorhizobium sp. M00.F.Ca.ET.038.03.1.1]RVC73464.1 hypothetical protein EN766_20815 [Mesorhizobium sp. M2A.F.Ca.ET.046.02.1.1]AZO38020.1 hypothetical protein EJ072_28940 [Mesorhizobium sp. M2A.F.Ca.ET.046.03.2.1]RWA93684.1 MAG: hypothetical protein EOQ31_00885 [Mesorhizobium sp.]
MKRILPLAFALAISAPAFAQTVDNQGAKQLSDDLARYFGKQAFDKGVLKVSVEGDAYKIALDIKALVNAVPEQKLLKFDMAPYALMVKPRSDGSWDVSSNFSQGASFEFEGPEGRQSMEFTIKDGKLTSVYDPALAAFTNATSSLAGMTMTSRDAKQQADASTGAGTATVVATKSASGGVDFTATQKVSDFVETIKINDADNGMNFPLTLKTPELSVDANGKGVRTKPLLDLLAFAVANEDEAKLKANQAELKSLMLAALPIWQRIEGNYGFKDFEVESPVGKFGAKQFSTAFGMDGVSQNGKVDYTIKASGLTIPHQTLPEWTTPLLPTDVDLNFGGANIDLDTMAKKAIEAFDLNKEPPLPDEFGKALVADFKAKNPKVVIGHSTVKNGDIEVALEGEMTFPGEKPDASVTIDVAGYDKLVDALKEGAKSDEQMAQAFPFALAVKGFGKTLPDGRLEWVINTKADGSVAVNGAMLKGPDEVQDDSAGQDDNSSGDDGANGTDDSTGGDDSDGGDNGGAGAKLQP